MLVRESQRHKWPRSRDLGDKGSGHALYLHEDRSANQKARIPRPAWTEPSGLVLLAVPASVAGLGARGHEVKSTREFSLLMRAALRIRMGETPGVDAD